MNLFAALVNPNGPSRSAVGCRSRRHRVSGLVYARDGVLLAGCESLPELATAP